MWGCGWAGDGRGMGSWIAAHAAADLVEGTAVRLPRGRTVRSLTRAKSGRSPKPFGCEEIRTRQQLLSRLVRLLPELELTASRLSWECHFTTTPCRNSVEIRQDGAVDQVKRVHQGGRQIANRTARWVPPVPKSVSNRLYLEIALWQRVGLS